MEGREHGISTTGASRWGRLRGRPERICSRQVAVRRAAAVRETALRKGGVGAASLGGRGLSGGSWRRRGSRALPHLGPGRRALGRRLGPRGPDTAGQYHEPRWVAGRSLHHGRLHRRGAQVDAESDQRCSHGRGDKSAVSSALFPGACRGGPSLAAPSATRKVKAVRLPIGRGRRSPATPRSGPGYRRRSGGRRDLEGTAQSGWGPGTVAATALLSSIVQGSLTGARDTERLCVPKSGLILPHAELPSLPRRLRASAAPQSC